MRFSFKTYPQAPAFAGRLPGLFVVVLADNRRPARVEGKGGFSVAIGRVVHNEPHAFARVTPSLVSGRRERCGLCGEYDAGGESVLLPILI